MRQKMRAAILFSAAVALPVAAWDVARTPPMGWNSWNHYGCSIDATILKAQADAMVSTGLSKVGYEFVNSDDCWMLAARSANGSQVPNPDKFPDGFAAVTAYIHSLGLKSGLYTAKGTSTCAGFAASCNHEAQDAAQWALWGIDYVKDDACSSCGDLSDDTLYHTMWQGIQASGREMVLTVEANPTDSIITLGGYGNAKRVGHDISPHWFSMVSLMDIGSGLWPYAHNSTNPLYGGWWNDLDMIEVGNGPDFSCAADAAALTRCRAHFTQWCIMKAPLVLGNDLSSIDAATLGVLSNAEAIAVNQDALGVQARRVAVSTPANVSLVDATGFDVLVVAARCDASRPSQAWRLLNASVPAPTRNQLFVVPCNASDPYQQWSFVGPAGITTLRNAGAGQCVDAAAGSGDPVEVSACSPDKATQQWTPEASGHVSTKGGAQCLDVFNNEGPDVDIYACKAAGDSDANQKWTLSADGTLVTALPAQTCLAVTDGPEGLGGYLSPALLSAAGEELCITSASDAWTAVPCTGGGTRPELILPTGPSNATGAANYSLTSGAKQSQLGWNNQPGSSGPWPHARYVENGGAQWTLDLAVAQQSPAGTRIMAADHLNIIDDDLVGGVGVGGDFCLDIVAGGTLEVWAGPLTGGRWALSLFNRSPADDTITAQWTSFNVSATAAFAVRDIWAAADRGTFTGSYSAVVAAHATAFLVLTPA